MRRTLPRARHPGLAEMIVLALLFMMLLLTLPHGPGRRPTCPAFAYDQRSGQPAAARRAALRPTAGRQRSGHPAASSGQPSDDPGTGLFPLPQSVRAGARRPDERAVAHWSAGRTTAWWCCRSTRRKPRRTPAPPEPPMSPLRSSRQAADWHYLTGSAPAIQAVTDAVGFRSRFDAADKAIPASRRHRLPDRHRHRIQLPAGPGLPAQRCRPRHTRAANGVTARALPILLLCFHYDPATGRYTLAIMRVLQLGAAITVLVVGGTIMLALRRERRPR